MNRSYCILASSLLFALSGCTAPVGSNLEVPQDAASTCQDHCQSIGMRLTAVAIMANNVGCVCEPRDASASNSSAVRQQSSATAGGMTAIAIQAEEQRRQSAQNGAVAGAIR